MSVAQPSISVPRCQRLAAFSSDRGLCSLNTARETRFSCFRSVTRRVPRILDTALQTLTDDQTGSTDEAVKETERASDASASASYRGKTAVVVGAGPAGAVAAGYLAKQGFTVKVFERRKDPATNPESNHRSIYITLVPSTLKVLKEANVELPSELGGYRNGLIRLNGSFNISAKGEVVENPGTTDFYLLGERHDIATSVLRDIRLKYSNLRFRFNHTCKGVSFADQTVSFVDKSGGEVKVCYDLLVAADGANSAVRDSLEAYDPDFKVNKVTSFRSYKSIRSLKLPSQKSDVAETLKPGWLTFAQMRRKRFKGKATPPRISYYLSEGGDVQALLAATKTLFDNITGVEDEWAEAALPVHFPPEWKKEIAVQLREKPMSTVAPITRVSKFNGPQTILIGDAGHSVTPALGVGCNSAIGDSKMLNMALDEAGGDIDAATQKFNDLRYEEIQSAQELQESVAGQALQQPLIRLWWPLVGGLHLGIYALGNRLLPKIIPVPVYFRFVREEITAKQAIDILKREGIIMLGLLTTAVVFFARNFLLQSMRYLLSKIPVV